MCALDKTGHGTKPGQISKFGQKPGLSREKTGLLFVLSGVRTNRCAGCDTEGGGALGFPPPPGKVSPPPELKLQGVR